MAPLIRFWGILLAVVARLFVGSRGPDIKFPGTLMFMPPVVGCAAGIEGFWFQAPDAGILFGFPSCGSGIPGKLFKFGGLV